VHLGLDWFSLPPVPRRDVATVGEGEAAAAPASP